MVLLDLLDSVLHSTAQRIEHVAMCTKSIKLHRLLLMDSVLHSTAQRIEHVAMCTKSIKLHQLLLMDSVLHIIAQRIEHVAVYQIHQTPPAAFDGFSTPQYSPANRACSHVYQIHQTPPAAFDGFSTPQYSPVNRACSHVYLIHQTPPAAFVGFRTVYSQAMDALHLLLYQSPTIDKSQDDEINVDLRTSGFDNEAVSVDTCAV